MCASALPSSAPPKVPRLPMSWGAVAVIGALLGYSSAATAQTPSLDLRNFRPATDPNGLLTLEPTATPDSGSWNLGAWLSYAHRPIVVEDNSGDNVATPVERQLSLDSLINVGVMDRLAISMSLPVILEQSGSDPDRLTGEARLPAQAIGDVQFGAKATLAPSADHGGFGLAALVRVTAPSGDPRSYVGEDEARGEFRLLGDLQLVAFELMATAGVRVRPREGEYLGERFGHDLPFGVGLSVRPQALGLDDSGRWRWNAELRGAAAITPNFAAGAQSPVLAGVSVRYRAGDVSLIAGAEVSVSDAVGDPLFRPILGLGWAPRFNDADHDGIEDTEDECPELAEDRDGFEDADGCPDWDNDDDGVPDEEDRCPREQEDEDDFLDDDGCIDPDNDGDGVLDEADQCPLEKGNAGGGRPGCPVHDRDGDGILDSQDRCPDQVEDKDGFQDTDGCPETDNDRDGVLDTDDACKNEAGSERADPELNGCPSPDKDGDTYPDATDQCVDEAEDFDGDKDDDGCPDSDADKPAWQRAKPLVGFEAKGAEWVVKWRIPPKLPPASLEFDSTSDTSLRALAVQLNSRPQWIVAVGARPAGVKPEAEQLALNQAFAIATRLRELTYRDGVAETVSWSAVKGQPGAWGHGFAMLVFAPADAAPGKKPRAKGRPVKQPPGRKKAAPKKGLAGSEPPAPKVIAPRPPGKKAP